MNKMSISEIYSEPEAYDLPRKGIALDNREAALVVVDPQIDLSSPQGIDWEAFKNSTTKNNTVENLETLFKMAKEAQMPVSVSPHYYFPHDHKWQSTAPGETSMHGAGMFNRKGPLTMENFENSGADFLSRFKPYIYDGETVIASPHKIFRPETNDLVLQLRKRGVPQIILADTAANLCIESHMRELIEQGSEAVVVKDAAAGPRIPEGDGYLVVLTNYRVIANDLWDTDTTAEKVKTAAKQQP